MNEETDKTQEVDKFFKDLPTEDKEAADIFGIQKPAEAKDEEKAEDKGDGEVPEKDAESRKNRRHRRRS